MYHPTSELRPSTKRRRLRRPQLQTHILRLQQHQRHRPRHRLNIVYDITYNIVYDITYNIVYNITCDNVSININARLRPALGLFNKLVLKNHPPPRNATQHVNDQEENSHSRFDRIDHRLKEALPPKPTLASDTP